jgi:membrane fusion protein (multidrug efflux system)
MARFRKVSRAMSQSSTMEAIGPVTGRADRRQEPDRSQRQAAAPAAEADAAVAEAPSATPAALAPDARPKQIRSAPLIPSRRRLSLRTGLMAGGVLLGSAGSGIAWLRGGRYATTDDAYVQAAKLSLSTDVSGIVKSVNVREGQVVKAGDLLFQVDPRQFQIARDSASANLAATLLTIESMQADYQVLLSNIAAEEAQQSLDQVEFDRAATLVRSDTVTKEAFDQARFALQGDKSKLDSLKHQAEEQLAKLGGKPDIPPTTHPLYLQAKAQLDEAQRQLDHASVRAPFNGVVTQVDSLQPGTYLVSQTASLTDTGAVALVSSDQMWVSANMKETDLTYVRPGDHVDLSVDTYPGQVWSGTVDAISPASGSEFSILPAENSSGNWVKVVQRIPVRIRIDPGPGDVVLRAGMSVSVSIDTGHRRSLSDLL